MMRKGETCSQEMCTFSQISFFGYFTYFLKLLSKIRRKQFSLLVFGLDESYSDHRSRKVNQGTWNLTLNVAFLSLFPPTVPPIPSFKQKTFFKVSIILKSSSSQKHSVKSVQIRSFSVPYFPEWKLYVNLHIHEIFSQRYCMKWVPGDPLKKMLN